MATRQYRFKLTDEDMFTGPYRDYGWKIGQWRHKPEKAPRKRSKSRPQPPRFVVEWKERGQIVRSVCDFPSYVAAVNHAGTIGVAKFEVIQISHDEAARLRRLSESQAIGKDIRAIEAAIEALQKRIRKSRIVYMLEFECQHVEAYALGKGRTQAMILFGGN